MRPTDTTYPREGTETHGCCATMVSWERHNLSPRGDGNSSLDGIVLFVFRTQLIPARGRKLPGVSALGVIARHNLSPRGDGNKGFNRTVHHVLDTTYPREGTETARPTEHGLGWQQLEGAYRRCVQVAARYEWVDIVRPHPSKHKPLEVPKYWRTAFKNMEIRRAESSRPAKAEVENQKWISGGLFMK